MHTGLLFVVALSITACVLAARRIASAHKRRAWLALLGHSVENPIPIHRFDEIDAHVRQSRCLCGGRQRFVSEGTARTAGRACRVVKVECGSCETEAFFFFEVTELYH